MAIKWERKASKLFCEELDCEFNEIKLGWLGNISGSLINSSEDAKKVSREDLKDTREEGARYYVPFRNGIFLSYAIAFADSLFVGKQEVWNIFVGFKCEGDEAFPDTTLEFVGKVNELMGVSGVRGRVIAPLIKKDKEDIVLLGSELGVNLKDTYSCYVGVKVSKNHCGSCLACRLRQEGFYWAGVGDDTSYEERMMDFRKAV